MRKLLKKQRFTPKSLTTDKLGSYGAAFRHLGLTCPHEQGLRANNRAENLYGAAGVKREDSICRPFGEPSAASRLAPIDR
jgi:transposase-like protein